MNICLSGDIKYNQRLENKFIGWGNLKNNTFYKLLEDKNVYIYEVVFNTSINYEVFKTKEDKYPQCVYVFNNYGKALEKFKELRNGINNDKVKESKGSEVTKLDKRQNIRDNGDKGGKRRVNSVKTDGTVRHRYNPNRRGV
jgi:hypothetical protein